MEITTQQLAIPVAGASMPAYLARPTAPGTYPGVLVFMEVFGVNKHIRDVANRVAAEGYVALAPDVFHRFAPGIDLPYDEQGVAQGIAHMGKVRASDAIADSAAAIDALMKRPEVGGTGVGAIGFCFGGHLAYLMACELPIKAAASFYGGFIAVAAPGNDGPPTVDRTPKIKGRVLCLFGEQDGYIALDQVDKIRTALAANKIRHEVVVYPGAGHGFFCNERGDYHPKSAEDAWRRVTALFREELR